ncbi:hypothetical protein DFH28DRAFT_1123275 [Melampsora americana]|nr:hypothetical protein DFH28DRAFT_1123275 [Melampsora americana]
MSSPKWSGTLKSKKKADLQDICRELNIEFRNDALKAELEKNIQNTLQQNPQLQSDPRFEELITPSAHSNSLNCRRSVTSKVKSAARTPDDEEQDDDLDDEPKEDDIKTRNPPKASTKEFGGWLTHVIHHASSKLGASQVTRQIKHATLGGVQGTQYALSSPWNIWSLKIFAELSYVYYSLVPIDHQALLHRSSNQYLVKLPNSVHAGIHLLKSAHFLRSLLEYSVLTIIAPLVIASLVNFAPPPHSRNSKGWLQRLSQLKPSPLTFSATRLAIVVLLHLVFRPSIRFGWPTTTTHTTSLVQREEFLRPGSDLIQDEVLNCQNSQLLGLEVLQFVLSGLGVVLGLHQLLSSSVKVSP